MPDVVLVCLLLLAVVLLLFGLLYSRYRNTPAARWKARVRAAVAEQEARVRLARRELATLADNADDRALRNDFLGRQLEVVAVEELARYPGIGPVTVSRLREAGLATVAACMRVRLSAIPGIGPVREKDLKDALKQIRRDAESRFDAGASSQAAAFRAEVKQREAGRDRRRQVADAELRSAESALASLRERARLADGVSFFGHLMGHRPSGLTDEVITEPPALPVKPPTLPVGEQAPAEPEALATATPTPVGQVSESVRSDAESRPLPAGSALAHASGSAGPAPLPLAEAPSLARLRTVLGFGFSVAKADGRIAAAERKQVRAFAERRYTTPDLALRLDAILAEVEANLPTLGDALREIKQTIPAEGWPDLYQFAVSVTDAAGERNTREVECLARVSEELGIGVKPPPAPMPAPMVATEPHAPLAEPECRTALEIAPETPLSVELIRRQYRLLSDRFAPEKFASHGPEFVRMAADKRDRAERAARHLLAGYNEPLEAPTPPPPQDLRHNPLLDEFFGA
jgi:uncharacterized tellurite resistance protein B-like protein/predicted flap endonuclease-1-like 5' DNA nuclease